MIDLLTERNPNQVAIIDCGAGITLHYEELCERVSTNARFLESSVGRALLLLVATNTVDSVVLYLACLTARIPVCLVERVSDTKLAPLLEAYRPAALLVPVDREGSDKKNLEPLPNSSYNLQRNNDAHRGPIHPDLALLLPTSGSTGCPKLVRLTLDNVVANARSIAEYLDLGPSERAIQSLPMYYSYGLSLINSHLMAGGSIVLSPHSCIRPEFWRDFNRTRCSSFAGVPYMYECLHRLHFDPQGNPTLRTMTQAGGALRRDLIQTFHHKARAAQARFFVMYGQTEATARIAYVPPERLGEKVGSIGVPIPRGHLSLGPLGDNRGTELVYRGPNVMMGYADGVESLAKGDELHGIVRTGDLASVDEEGFFSITGRLKRFAKLFGRRISLEDIEQRIEAKYRVSVAAVERNESLHIFTEAADPTNAGDIRSDLATELMVPLNSIHVETVPEIRFNSNGKKDYRSFV